MSNIRLVSDSSTVNSEPPKAYALHLSEKTTYTPGFQDGVPCHTTKTRGSLKMQSAVTAPDDTAKAPHL
ncbi:hypothetical protein MRX96_019149 [Rhipicephalus microplus]